MGEKGLLQDEAIENPPQTGEKKAGAAHPPIPAESKPNWRLKDKGTAIDENHPGVTAAWNPATGIWVDPGTGKPAVGIPFALVESTDGSFQPYVYNVKTREKKAWSEDRQAWEPVPDSDNEQPGPRPQSE